MKNIIRILSLSAAISCALLAGCSKSNDGAPSASVAGSQAGDNGPVAMKLKWTVGKQYLQEMTMSQRSEILMPGRPAPMHQQTEITQGFSLSALKQRPEGGAELELKYTSQKISSKMDGRVVMNFDSADDSAKDANKEPASMLYRLIGAHVDYLTDAEGKVETMENYQEFIDHLTEGASAPTKMMLKSMFSEWTMKEFGSASKGLPDKPVKIGDTWPVKQEITDPNLGSLHIKMKLKFAGWEQHADRHCAVLTYAGELTSKAPSTPGGMGVSIDDGVLKGKTWFDPAEGVMVESTGDQSMTVNIKMQGTSMTSKMKQTVGMKLVGIEDVAK